MVLWKEYALSIIGCVLFCGIISHIVSDLHYKNVIRMICGTLLAVTVLGPLTSVDFTGSLDIDMTRYSPDAYINIGRQEALKGQQRCIKEAFESYICNKANDIGAAVTADFSLNENLEPCFVQVYGQFDSDQQQFLGHILEDDLGITKENQVWIGNQEEHSS